MEVTVMTYSCDGQSPLLSTTCKILTEFTCGLLRNDLFYLHKTMSNKPTVYKSMMAVFTLE